MSELGLPSGAGTVDDIEMTELTTSATTTVNTADPQEDNSSTIIIKLKSSGEDQEGLSRPDPDEEVDFPPQDDDVEEDPDPCAEDDSVMVGVEIFEESDLETDTDNKLQLYSDVDVDVDPSEDPALPILLAEHLEKKVTVLPGVTLGTGISIPLKPKSKRGTNREPSRLSLEDRIKCIRMCCRYNSLADVQKAWKQKYGTEPPCRKTMSTLNKKFLKTGSVADLTRTGRPKSTRTEEVVARVEAAISKDPSKSIRTLAKELGINQASVHRIKKEFEEKRSTLKMENKKLKDNLNDALKRIVLLERRLMRNLNQEKADDMGVETVLISTTGGESHGIPSNLDVQTGSGHQTIFALNSANGQVSIPSLLRVQQPGGQDTYHIITLPQGSSHQLLSLEESPSVQLSITNQNDGSSSNNTQVQTSSSNLIPILPAPSNSKGASFVYE